MGDVGDAVELTFTTTPGAAVTASWICEPGITVIDQQPVPEQPPGSGKYPATFLLSSAGLWRAVFVATGPVAATETYFERADPLTGPPPLATVGELAELFRPLTTAEQSLAAALLRRASGMVRSRLPNVDIRIAAGTLDAGQAALAVIHMVLRVMRNPAGVRTETVGPFTRTFDTRSSGLLALTDAELALLAPRRRRRAPAGTIRIRAGLAPSPWGRDVRRW